PTPRPPNPPPTRVCPGIALAKSTVTRMTITPTHFCALPLPSCLGHIIRSFTRLLMTAPLRVCSLSPATHHCHNAACITWSGCSPRALLVTLPHVILPPCA